VSKYAGKDGVIKVGANAIGEVKSFELNTSAELIEASIIGSDWSESIAGLLSWEISVEAYYDPADTAQAQLVEGAEVTFNVYPAGVGVELLSGSGMVTAVSIAVANDNVVSYNITAKGDGELGRT